MLKGVVISYSVTILISPNSLLHHTKLPDAKLLVDDDSICRYYVSVCDSDTASLDVTSSAPRITSITGQTVGVVTGTQQRVIVST